MITFHGWLEKRWGGWLQKQRTTVKVWSSDWAGKGFWGHIIGMSAGRTR